MPCNVFQRVFANTDLDLPSADQGPARPGRARFHQRLARFACYAIEREWNRPWAAIETRRRYYPIHVRAWAETARGLAGCFRRNEVLVYRCLLIVPAKITIGISTFDPCILSMARVVRGL